MLFFKEILAENPLQPTGHSAIVSSSPTVCWSGVKSWRLWLYKLPLQDVHHLTLENNGAVCWTPS